MKQHFKRQSRKLKTSWRQAWCMQNPHSFNKSRGSKALFLSCLTNSRFIINSTHSHFQVSSPLPHSTFRWIREFSMVSTVNSSLVLFDRFSLANYNSVTFATSGAGKSYAIKLEILRSMMMGAEVLVIDP